MMPAFLPAVATEPAASCAPSHAAPPSIEIVLGASTIRITGPVDGKTLTVVLRAVKAAAP